MAAGSASRRVPRNVSYMPAKLVPVRSSSGLEERTAKTSPGRPAMAAFSSSAMRSVRSSPAASIFTASHRSRLGVASNVFHWSVALIRSVHSAKNATLSATPSGTRKPARVVVIRLSALPPTWPSSRCSSVSKRWTVVIPILLLMAAPRHRVRRLRGPECSRRHERILR